MGLNTDLGKNLDGVWFSWHFYRIFGPLTAGVTLQDLLQFSTELGGYLRMREHAGSKVSFFVYLFSLSVSRRTVVFSVWPSALTRGSPSTRRPASRCTSIAGTYTQTHVSTFSFSKYFLLSTQHTDWKKFFCLNKLQHKVQTWVRKGLPKHQEWCHAYSSKNVIRTSTMTSIV